MSHFCLWLRSWRRPFYKTMALLRSTSCVKSKNLVRWIATLAEAHHGTHSRSEWCQWIQIICNLRFTQHVACLLTTAAEEVNAPPLPSNLGVNRLSRQLSPAFCRIKLLSQRPRPKTRSSAVILHKSLPAFNVLLTEVHHGRVSFFKPKNNKLPVGFCSSSWYLGMKVV